MHQRQMQAFAAITKRNTFKRSLSGLQLTLANPLHQGLTSPPETPISWDSNDFAGSGEDCADLELEPGDVLVAPFTDAAWTPLFLIAGAVVVDVGAMNSHAVVVSRELGIPSVLSVTTGTAQLADGMVVTVDGVAGTVTVDSTAGAATV